MTATLIIFLRLSVFHGLAYWVGSKLFGDQTLGPRTPFLELNVLLVGPLCALPVIYHAPVEFPAWNMIWILPVILLLYDLCFYVVHRAAHEIPLIYNCIHSYHHRWYSTDAGLSAFDTHPLEHALLNVGPMMVLLWWWNVDMYTCLLVSTVGTLYSQFAHGSFGNGLEHRRHDIHHAQRKYNFSSSRLWDRIGGTEYPRTSRTST